MTLQFSSRLKTYIEQFINQKRSLGFPYETSARTLLEFDRFCMEFYPDAETVTPALARAWAVIKPTEKPASFCNRMAPVRELARYMNRNGMNACIIPPELAPNGGRRHVPHIFTPDELKLFFQAADSQPVIPCSRLRHLQIPVIFRFMYACGLRPNEVRQIRTRDLNTGSSTLFIPESKGHKDRMVVLPAELAGICSVYQEHLAAAFPGSEFFFPCQRQGGKPYNAGWLIKAFRRCWEDAGLCSFSGSRPRPYDFRHTFATYRLYKWMKEKKDLSVCLPYLSAYMGHADFSKTAYYIHLIPEFFSEMSGMDTDCCEPLIPEVPYEDKR